MRHRSKSARHGGVVSTERCEPAGAQAAADGGLSDTQVMKILEERRADDRAAQAAEQTFSHIPLLRPEDTGTRLALKNAVKRGDPVSFAVQLLWSPQLIDLKDTPRDPIFRSYTVYTTRVRNDGREWFELRLGFFADALSARQVAHYMQPEYNSAAVVPVDLEERDAARAAASAASAARGAVGNRSAACATAAACATSAAVAASSAAAPPCEGPSAAVPAAAGRRRLFLIRRGG